MRIIWEDMVLYSEFSPLKSRTSIKLFANLNNYFFNLFEWKGLEDIEGFQLEEILNTKGNVAIFRYGGKLICAPVIVKSRNYLGLINTASPIAVYKNYGQDTAIEYIELTKDNAVFISNNESHTPTLFWVWDLIKAYGEIMDTYTDNLPLKVIAGLIPTSTPTAIKSMKQELKKAFENPYGVVPVHMNLMNSALGFQPFPISNNVDIKSVSDGLDYILNTINQLLGVKRNNNQDKKERLVVDEVNIENFKDEAIISTMLKMRQITIEDFKRVLELDVSVDLLQQEEPQSENKEGEEVDEL